jgi:beta-fructofuranosidase
MNDPVGLGHWEGAYHFFFQHNPDDPVWGKMHWGHARSIDLVHWMDLPLALSPSVEGLDADGCWSGCVVENCGTYFAFYTGVEPERLCMATSKDGLLTWEKFNSRPLISYPPDGMKVSGFRDPRVWREGQLWYLLMGSGVEGSGGAALLYRSADMLNWEYIKPFLESKHLAEGEINTGSMWECPDFFPLGGRHVLCFSAYDAGLRRGLQSIYLIGDYKKNNFTVRKMGMLDWGGITYYAPQSFLDEKGRRIQFGWLQEERSVEAQIEAGWSGTASLPRILSLDQEGELKIEPVPELNILRGNAIETRPFLLTPNSTCMFPGLSGAALELEAEFELDDRYPDLTFGLLLRCSPDGSEETRIIYSSRKRCLLVDTRKSGGSTLGEIKEGQLSLRQGENLRLRVFLDHSILEVFGGESFWISSRIYPNRPDSMGVGVFVDGGSVLLKSMTGWEMESIWED